MNTIKVVEDSNEMCEALTLLQEEVDFRWCVYTNEGKTTRVDVGKDADTHDKAYLVGEEIEF